MFTRERGECRYDVSNSCEKGCEDLLSSEEVERGARKEASPLRLATRYTTQSLTSLLMSLLVLKYFDDNSCISNGWFDSGMRFH